MNSSHTHLDQTGHLSPHHHHHHHHHHRHHRHCHHHNHHHHHYPLSLSSQHYHHHHHHHHHHLYVQPHCALYNQFPHHPNFNFCPNLINPPPQIPPPAHSLSPQYEAAQSSHQTQMLQDEDLQQIEDEDEEPIFVMTDEWREFFAKSEARRREAKKLAKKQGKK